MFTQGDRVEYGGKGKYAWRGRVIAQHDGGEYVDVQWDHNEPGDIDVAVRVADGLRPETIP